MMTKIIDGIFNVGVNGNNAYLIASEKNVLIDTVSEAQSDELIENIEKILPVTKLDYIVCNHTEPNKSGAVKKLLQLNPKVEIIGTIAAMRNLKEITNTSFSEHIAKEGATLEIGGFTLKFCIVPNLNWPDTMVTYEATNKILFSCDIFSRENGGTLQEYYDKYFMPYKGFVKKAIEKLSEFSIELICTGSGALIENVYKAFSHYKEWSREDIAENAVILFASKYGSTSYMAEIIRDTLTENGLETVCYDVYSTDADIIIKAANQAKAVIVGTPTINRNADKKVWNILTSLDAVNIRNKPCFVFGSYGWGGDGMDLIQKLMLQLKMRPFDKPFGSLFALSDEKKTELVKYTKHFSKITQNI